MKSLPLDSLSFTEKKKKINENPFEFLGNELTLKFKYYDSFEKKKAGKREEKSSIELFLRKTSPFKDEEGRRTLYLAQFLKPESTELAWIITESRSVGRGRSVKAWAEMRDDKTERGSDNF